MKVGLHFTSLNDSMSALKFGALSFKVAECRKALSYFVFNSF